VCKLKAVFYEVGGVHNICEIKTKAIILNLYSPIRLYGVVCSLEQENVHFYYNQETAEWQMTLILAW